MKFRTEIELKHPLPGAINLSDTIWTIGSCFADEIGDKMLSEGFKVEVNPLGTLYNPLSILHSVSNLVKGKRYEPTDFFEYEGKFRSFDFHSLFARRSAEASAEFVNSTLDRLRSELPQLSVVMLTLGSSRGFFLKNDAKNDSPGRIVANCHKQHPALFTEDEISVDDCTAALSRTISLLRSAAPNLRTIILTVSPIRHKAYGLHADRLSKARLLLAVDTIVNSFSGKSSASETAESRDATCIYFPSYEIMNDDLRDYRFYAADMVHPSPVAVDYIYSIFTQTFYTPATIAQAAANLRGFRRTLHRPLS